MVDWLACGKSLLLSANALTTRKRDPLGHELICNPEAGSVLEFSPIVYELFQISNLGVTTLRSLK